jgi:spore coat protein H
MRKLMRITLAVIIAVFLIAVSLASLANPNLGQAAPAKTAQRGPDPIEPTMAATAQNEPVTKVSLDIDNLPLADNPDLYQYDDPGSVVTMYVTVRRGNDLEDTDHTWREVNDATKYFFEVMRRVYAPKAEAILQIGDEKGPLPGELGYGETLPNATIMIRGNSTSRAAQKSYKIVLFDNAGEWRGQSTINLNKSMFDPTRVKNKLAFDLIKEIPDMVSLRTQFVHLYVKDETASPPQRAFADYGLFTQIEMPNRKFLKNRSLDRNGQLYKAIQFEFYRYPEKILLAGDPLYDEDTFSTVLEIHGNDDHAKLIRMLDDVNNWAIPIEQTFAQYFDEDNYFTWMAFNILVENVDTHAQNFYLYSPQNGQKWYFIPWDYDGALDRQEHAELISPFHRGISTYWNVVLHRRVLTVPAYREKLDVKVEEVAKIVSRERIAELIEIYRPIADKYVRRLPDMLELPLPLDARARVYDMLPDEPRVNYAMYLEDLQGPMPFFLGTPQKIGEKLRFVWDEAYDFNAQEITYQFEVSKNWDFENNVYDETLIDGYNIEIPMLKPGLYFWRVSAKNENGKMQYPFDFYVDSIGFWHNGMKYMYITSEGEILEKQVE